MKDNVIKEICRACWLTQQELASVTGVKLQRLKDISAGRVDGFKIDEVIVLVEKLHLNYDWLITGDGSIFKDGYGRDVPTNQEFVLDVINRMVKIAEPDAYLPVYDDALGLTLGTATKWIKQASIPFWFIQKFSNEKSVSITKIIYGVDEAEYPPRNIHTENKGSEPLKVINRLASRQEKETIKIKRYKVSGGAGNGVVNYEEPIIEFVELSALYVRKELGIRHSEIAIISVKGSSMEPTLSDGDQIFVDLTRTRIESADVYVIRVDSELLIKRVQFKTDGMVWLISDNKLFDPEQLTKQEAESLCVVGKVLPCKFGKYSL